MIGIIRDLAPSSPALGLALDEVLMETARHRGTTTVRMWVNDRAVVIGRSQVLAAEVDIEQANRYGIPILRRISGGGAVYHHPGNLNVSVCTHTGLHRQLRGVDATFHQLGGAIAAALGAVGIAAVSDGNMLRLSAVKIGGAAQARRGAGLLYHTTIIVYPDTIPMARLLLAMRPGYRTSGVPSHPVPTASIFALIETPLTMATIADAVAAGIAASFGEPMATTTVTTTELRMARELARQKYGSDQWNRRR